MLENCECWVVVSNFTEKGIVSRRYSKSIPIKEKDLNVLNTYYASILNYTKDDVLIGPLPVAYHPELLVLMYKFDIIDSEIKDKRIMDKEGKTLGVVSFFYNIQYDESILNSRKDILQQVKNWCNKFKDISQIDDSQIDTLNRQIKSVESMDLTNGIHIGSDEEYKLINRLLDFLAKSIRGQFDLQIISDTTAYLDIIKDIIFKYGSKSITSYKKDPNKLLSEIKIGTLSVHLQSSNDFKEFSKNKSFIYFAEIGDMYASQKTLYTFQSLVDSLANNEQCLLCIYSPNKQFNLPGSPLFDIASSATGKNLSVFELTNNQTLEPIIIFLYQLIERMQ